MKYIKRFSLINENKNKSKLTLEIFQEIMNVFTDDYSYYMDDRENAPFILEIILFNRDDMFDSYSDIIEPLGELNDYDTYLNLTDDNDIDPVLTEIKSIESKIKNFNLSKIIEKAKNHYKVYEKTLEIYKTIIDESIIERLSQYDLETIEIKNGFINSYEYTCEILVY